MIDALSTGNRAIVTTNTTADNLGVINSSGCNWCPGRWRFFMAELALITSVYVGSTLSAGGRTIMAADTVVNDWDVVNNRGKPGIDCMTGITFLDGGNMGWPLPCGNHVIVATTAYPDDFSVINIGVSNRCPWCGSWLVAGITNVTAIDMSCTFTAGDGAIVTTGTTTDDLGMVDRARNHRCPECGCHFMAQMTLITGINMAGTLTTCRSAIMATDTVVDKS